MHSVRPRVVLVCDDEAPIRQVIAHKLRANGYEVHEARTGKEGLDAVEGGLTPDLVISDFQMPVMSGLDMCKALREHPRTSATPVLMLTARGYILPSEDLSATNIRLVIAKPFGVKQLMDRVTEVLRAAEGSADDPARRAA